MSAVSHEDVPFEAAGETPGCPWSAWMWQAIIAVAMIDAAWLLATPLRLSTASLITIGWIGGVVLAGRWIAPKLHRHPRLHTIATGGIILLAAWPALRLFNHLTMTTALPWVDPALAAWDRQIGFDWLGYVGTIDRYPKLIELMGMTYWGLNSYSAVLFLILALGSQPATRCAEFLKLFLITAIACMAIGMFFPAQSANIFHAVAEDTFRNVPPGMGAYHLEALETLRTDPAAELELVHLAGLVTFPSFHTAMGVLAIYCARHYLALLALSLVVNLTMIASTPLFGAHYAIDLIGGTLVAGAAILCLRMKPARGLVPAQLPRWRIRSLS